MLKLEMENILHSELICNGPNFYRFMQVHENEEDQAIILSTESQCVLYILHNIYKGTKDFKKAKFQPVIITFKT